MEFTNGGDQKIAMTAGAGRPDNTPIHEEPQPAPQPMQELVAQMERSWSDIGALISRTDQIEATMRRIDRQTIMMVGTLALVLWVTRNALTKVEELAVTNGP